MGKPKIQNEMRKSFLSSIGLNPEDLVVWQKKWKGLKGTSASRGTAFLLSFEDYVTIAADSGLKSPDLIGRGLGKYGMGRLGDSGDYVIGNCRFITNAQNIEERNLNGGTERRTKKLSKSFKAVSPSGEVFTGHNISKFTRDMGLTSGSLSGCARGIYAQHLGWTCEYI